MEKVLRRRGGAVTIDIDTDAGYVEYAIGQPRSLTYTELNNMAEDASYSIAKVVLTLKGAITPAACEQCEGPIHSLRVVETGQVFEVVGDVQGGPDVMLRARLEGWPGDHTYLVPVPAR